MTELCSVCYIVSFYSCKYFTVRDRIFVLLLLLLQVDHHDYYTSRFIEPGNEANGLWFELDSLVGSGATSVDEDASETVIQGSHRAYEVVSVN